MDSECIAVSTIPVSTAAKITWGVMMSKVHHV